MFAAALAPEEPNVYRHRTVPETKKLQRSEMRDREFVRTTFRSAGAGKSKNIGQL